MKNGKCVVSCKILVLFLVLILFKDLFILPQPTNALTITVDGNPSDWLGEGPDPGSSDSIAGQFIYTDFTGDDVGYGPLIYPEGIPDGCADILEFRVTTDITKMYLLIQMRKIADPTKVVVHILSDLPDYDPAKEPDKFTWTTGGNEGRIPIWSYEKTKIGVGITIADPYGSLTTREENTVYYELAADTNDPDMIQVAANTNFNAFEVSLILSDLEGWIGLEEGAINSGVTLYFLAMAYRIDAPIEFGAHEVNEADVIDESEKTRVTAWEDPDIYDMIGYNTKEDQISALSEWAPGGDRKCVHFPSTSPAWLEVEFPLPIPPTTFGVQSQLSIDEINPNSSFILSVTVINSGKEAWDVFMSYNIPSEFKIISGSLVPGPVNEDLSQTENETFYVLDDEFEVFESRSYSLKLQAPGTEGSYYITFGFRYTTLNETGTLNVTDSNGELVTLSSSASILLEVAYPLVYGGGYPAVGSETGALIVLLGIPVILAIARVLIEVWSKRKGG
ncbi:MAG: hypothetical protein ACFFB5_10445 [Promethearchaeota archaeon]